MKALVTAAILSALFAVGFALKCYICVAECDKKLGNALECPDGYNTCYTKEVVGFVTRGCTKDTECQGSDCCKTELCNGSVAVQMSVAFILVAAVINMYLLH